MKLINWATKNGEAGINVGGVDITFVVAKPLPPLPYSHPQFEDILSPEARLMMKALEDKIRSQLYEPH